MGSAIQQIEDIQGMELFLSGEDFTQNQVCDVLGLHSAVASIRLREMFFDGLLNRREEKAANNATGYLVFWSRRRALKSNPLTMKWGTA